MGIHILLHRVLHLENYLNCTEDLTCTLRSPNGLVNYFCVIWCEPAAQQVRTRNEGNCRRQDMMQLLHDSDGRAGN